MLHATRYSLLTLSLVQPAASLLAAPVRIGSRRASVASRHAAVSLELRMPEDESTIDALIQRTIEYPQEGLVVVLHFNDPLAETKQSAWEVPSWNAGDISATTSTDIVMRVANDYENSKKFGGRPLVVLQIDNVAQGGLNVICAKRQISTFPTIQIWSRGGCEVVSQDQLEPRLVELGVASAARKPGAGRTAGGSTSGAGAGAIGPRAGPAAGDVDMFGVGSGGAGLTQAAVRRAMSNAPAQDYRNPRVDTAAKEERAATNAAAKADAVDFGALFDDDFDSDLYDGFVPPGVVD
tara:strand:+ start:1411 stop:2292 length:882 start_codon:yes stop_codon:yes gene_type:complete